MKIGIDLLWVRPGKNGGTESYIRNLLDGFIQFDKENEYVLFVSKDNKNSFVSYCGTGFSLYECNVNSASFVKRVIWENLHLSKLGKKHELDVWFMPVYSRPYFMSKKIPVITVIHDLQALHYPEYFSKFRNRFFRTMWKRDCKTSTKIVTISEFCKHDILKNYKIPEERVQVIYNPVITKASGLDFNVLADKFKIEDGRYFYTVSSLAKHKNLITLLNAFKILADKGNTEKLIISGVSVNAENEILKFVSANELSDFVKFTGFITNEERDCLYEHTKAFLFPSVFEGFGMPPIEAMRRGVPTVTTKMTSIYEVTQGKAIYVDDPFSEKEWADKIKDIIPNAAVEEKFEEYSLEAVTGKYLKLFRDCENKRVNA